MLDEIQDLHRENQGFSRELDRYDALYRKMLNDYMGILEENKAYLLKFQEIEKS